jgi:hypothetical protein
MESFLYDALFSTVEHFGADFGIISTVESGAKMKIHRLRFSDSFKGRQEDLKKLSGVLVDQEESPIKTASKNRSPLILDMDSYHSPYKASVEEAGTAGSVALVTFSLPSGESRGLLELFGVSPDLKEDSDTLEEIGMQFAVYIDDYRRTSRLTDRAQALRELSLINKAIQAPQEINKVVEVILKYTFTFFEADGSSILLEDKDDNIAFVVATGEKANDLKNVSLNKNEGIVGWVMTNQEALLVENADEDKRFSRRVDKLTDFETGSVMCVPLTVFNEPVGVLEVLRQKGSPPYNPNDLELLNILSTYVSLALYKERFFIQRDQWFKSTLKFLDQMIGVKDHLFPGSKKMLKKYITLFGLGMSR